MITTAFAGEIMALLFNGLAIDGIARNASGPITQYYLSLMKTDPGKDGTQVTQEVAYGGYARQATARNSTAWSQSENRVTVVSSIEFPKATTAPGVPVVTHVGVGTAATGPGRLLFRLRLDNPIRIETGTAPRIEAGSHIYMLTEWPYE